MPFSDIDRENLGVARELNFLRELGYKRRGATGAVERKAKKDASLAAVMREHEEAILNGLKLTINEYAGVTSPRLVREYYEAARTLNTLKEVLGDG